jgi:four helix bundle protein
MLNQKYKHQFDLEDRTATFSNIILNFCRTITINYLTENQIRQLIKSATSIGANYMEANGSDSKRDFRSKICICKKEAKETTYWLKILFNLFPNKSDELKKLWAEAQELLLIFSAILKNT